MNKRYQFIDILRGIAVIGMIFYHIVFLADFFQIINLNIEYSLWMLVLGNLVRILFFGLVGVSTYLISLKYDKRPYFIKQLGRANKILWAGILMTFATFLIFPQYTIYFGALHSIALGILLAGLFARYETLNFLLGVSLLTLNIILANCSDLFYPLSYVLGLSCTALPTFDYFPFLPWLGYIFLGQSFAKELLRLGENFKTNKFYLVEYCGRHALSLYILHIPLLYLIILLIKQVF